MSDGKFGFSVQKQIYQGLGGTEKYNRKVWEDFADKVGWRGRKRAGRRGEENFYEFGWLSYRDLTFRFEWYMGHLPWVLGLFCGSSTFLCERDRIRVRRDVKIYGEVSEGSEQSWTSFLSRKDL